MKKIFKKYLTKSTFKVSPHTVSVTLKDKTFTGLRVLHISDLHIDTYTPDKQIKYLIDTINTIECDFVVISGDIIDCKIDKIKTKLSFFQDIQQTTYFVSGNHDLVYGYDKLNKIFKQYNIHSLDNRFEILEYNNKKFILWGLSDRFSKFFKIKREEIKLVNQINKIELPKISVAHQPKDYTYALNTNSSLFLCGHTHGGQIYPFEYLVRLVQPFIKGLHYRKNTAIYINSGIGSWGIKYRFLSKAEITIIEVE